MCRARRNRPEPPFLPPRAWTSPKSVSTDPLIEKPEHRVEGTVAHQVLVPGLLRVPELLRLRRRIEQRAPKPDRDNPVPLAMQYQDRRPDIADLGRRVETVAHQSRSGHKGIMVLGHFGH